MPGWTPTKENLASCTEAVAKARLNTSDTIVIDLWSNSTLLGTDDMGFPKKPVKSTLDGKNHITGKLQAAPGTVFEKILSNADVVLRPAEPAKVVFVAPVPRYITGKCCNDEQHLTNYSTDSLWFEIE